MSADKKWSEMTKQEQGAAATGLLIELFGCPVVSMQEGVPYQMSGAEMLKNFAPDRPEWRNSEGAELYDPKAALTSAGHLTGEFMLTLHRDGEIHAYHRADWATGVTFDGMGDGDVKTAKRILPAYRIGAAP